MAKNEDNTPEIDTKELTNTQQRKAAFILHYPRFGSVGETLKHIKVKSRRTFYGWLKKDKPFAAIYEKELKPNRIDEILTATYQVATGKKNAKEGQTSLARYLLACLEPTKFAEKYLMELAGKGGKEIILRVVYDSDDRAKGTTGTPPQP